MKVFTQAAFAATLAFAAYPVASWAADAVTLSVSLDTSPQHVRNVWFKTFGERLEANSGGALKLEIFEAASKYKDSEAAAAIAQGAIDIVAPQYQLISRFVPEADFEQLPMFYGVEPAKIYAVVDGAPGAELNSRIEQKLHIKVLGRAIDLGFGTVFSTSTELTAPDSLNGLKVRVPGGPATIQRYEIMGSAPVQIAWPDVPQALQTGTISALWSTQESVASAKLWDAGVKFALNDRQAIVQYLPLINQQTYDKLSPDLQKVLNDTWDQLVDEQRADAAKRQMDAQDLNASHGISTVDPTPESLAAMRDKLIAAQPELVEKLGMDKAFVAQVQSALSN